MKNFEHATKRFILIVILCFVALSFLCSSVFAGSGWYRVNILVAYDEEWRQIAWNKYLYTPEYLAWMFIDDIGYEFYHHHQIVFQIVEYMEYDSDNSYTHSLTRLAEVMWKAKTAGDTQFVSGHTTEAGNLVHILIAFTDQAITDAYGRADRSVGAVIVMEYTYPAWHPLQEQHTDNILQHELSHLWECNFHDIQNFDCIMNEWRARPQDRPYCFFTNNWCSACENIIASHIDKFGHELSGGGGGGYRHCLC